MFTQKCFSDEKYYSPYFMRHAFFNFNYQLLCSIFFPLQNETKHRPL
jgi:hypothetical protein